MHAAAQTIIRLGSGCIFPLSCTNIFTETFPEVLINTSPQSPVQTLSVSQGGD